eukprot:7382163-Prymnesium_polylepis.1
MALDDDGDGGGMSAGEQGGEHGEEHGEVLGEEQGAELGEEQGAELGAELGRPDEAENDEGEKGEEEDDSEEEENEEWRQRADTHRRRQEAVEEERRGLRTRQLADMMFSLARTPKARFGKRRWLWMRMCIEQHWSREDAARYFKMQKQIERGLGLNSRDDVKRLTDEFLGENNL